MLNSSTRSPDRNVLLQSLLTYAHAHLFTVVLAAQARLFRCLAQHPVHLVLALELLKFVLHIDLVVTTPALSHAAAEGRNERTRV